MSGLLLFTPKNSWHPLKGHAQIGLIIKQTLISGVFGVV